jgi:SAM-dependent methyltransferase
VNNRETGRTFHICPACYYIFEHTDEKRVGQAEEEEFFKRQWEASPEGGNPDCYKHVKSLLETSGRLDIATLDFGCGDGGLVRFLRDGGIKAFGVDRVPVDNDMKEYVYTDLDRLPDMKFDLITAVEVMEHLHDPVGILEKLAPLLAEDGFIYLTTMLTNRAMPGIRFFPYWIYQADATHVGFFHEKTFDIIAEKLGLDLQVFGTGDVVLDSSFRRVITVHENRYAFGNEGDDSPNWPVDRKKPNA